MGSDYYIGWDVGAWSCKTSNKSCDALVVLQGNHGLVGSSYRNSLKCAITEANDSTEFLEILFHLCGLGLYNGEKVCLAIDTPLGYSKEFVNLISAYSFSCSVFDADPSQFQHANNPFLFRKTERHLFAQKIIYPNNRQIMPLSAVNDMIGSQSTKGILVIAKFAPKIASHGVWESSNRNLTIIETYPSVNFEIVIPDVLIDSHTDIKDAYRCAYIAYMFKADKTKLVPPSVIEVSKEDIKEGWIWYLRKSAF